MVWMLKRYLADTKLRAFVEAMAALLGKYLKTDVIKPMLDQI